jgi:hypothetical protein
VHGNGAGLPDAGGTNPQLAESCCVGHSDNLEHQNERPLIEAG